nr:KOW domain-containing RNA-binding protein [Rubeoparvulum massiliense]
MNVVDSDARPRIGEIVRICRGRDAGNYAIIVGFEDDRYLLLADGNKRKFDTPKKKNISHVEFQHAIAPDVVKAMHENNRVSNGKIRFAIQQFITERAEVSEKGEISHG